MVELLGSGYVIDHCISAFSKEQEEKAFRIYLTDALKVISENTAGGERRSAMSKRWIELMDIQTEEPMGTMSADEKADKIITDLKNRLNRKEVT